MTATVPTGARPRRGRPRHHESPRSRVRAPQDAGVPAHESARPPVAATQLTSVVEVDLTGVAEGAVLATVATAAVRAASAHPAVVRSGGVHLGVLGEDGTTRVVVEDADDLTAAALSARVADGLRADVGWTLGVVDTGSQGVLLETPLLGPERTAVLGIGAVVRRPVVLPSHGGEAIVVRAMAHLSLSYDSGMMRGADAARFLASVGRVLEGGDA